MTRADNSSFLAQANDRRHQTALLAARHAIQELQRQGQAVNFSTVAQISRRLPGMALPPRPDPRPHQPPAGTQATAARRAAAHRATADSLRQRLDAARAENTRLRAENRSLRDQLARHLGLQRTQHGEHTSAEPR